MVLAESITEVAPPQYAPATHENLEWAIIFQRDDKRIRRLTDCGKRLSRVFQSPCGALMRAYCSCREHLCPKEREKSLREQTDTALQAATDLEHPTLYVANWTGPDASWDILASMRKTLTADQDVRYWMQDFRPHRDGWECRLAWIGQGPTPEISGVQLNPFSVNLVLVEAFLCFVRTPIDAFAAGDGLLAQYLDVTRRRHFVQRLGRKGKRAGARVASGDGTVTGLLSEVRAVLRGETTPLGVESNETHDQRNGHNDAAVPNGASSSGADSRGLAGDTAGLMAPGPRDGQPANGHSGPSLVPPLGTPAQILQPRQKGPNVRCRRCGSREWSYIGHYMESEEGLVKIRGGGPEWLALSDIDLTMDEEQAFKRGRPTW